MTITDVWGQAKGTNDLFCLLLWRVNQQLPRWVQKGPNQRMRSISWCMILSKEERQQWGDMRTMWRVWRVGGLIESTWAEQKVMTGLPSVCWAVLSNRLQWSAVCCGGGGGGSKLSILSRQRNIIWGTYNLWPRLRGKAVTRPCLWRAGPGFFRYTPGPQNQTCVAQELVFFLDTDQSSHTKTCY